MLRSMFTGISGLKTHQTRMDVVANNVANINSTGYKKGRANFQDIISQSLSGASGATTAGTGGTNAKQVGLGVSLGSIDTLFTQGNLQVTGVNTDMAIQGNGMFILNDGASTDYTRAGIFSLDEDGTLVNAANGWNVQGWQADNTGALDTTQAIGNISVPVGSSIPANETTSITYTGNLDSGSAVGDSYVTSINVYDSLGATHTVTLTFAKTAANTWSATASGVGVGGAASTLIYDPADGSFDAGLSTVNNITLASPPAATAAVFTPGFTTSTQYAADNSIIASSQDGYASGALQSYSIGDSGVITGLFSNGIRRSLAQIALAHFANYGGLNREGDNMFAETANSGVAQVGVAKNGARGSIIGGTLEMSNVDLSEEFTSMITTERGFQANSRSVTTSDEILQELLNLKR